MLCTHNSLHTIPIYLDRVGQTMLTRVKRFLVNQIRPWLCRLDHPQKRSSSPDPLPDFLSQNLLPPPLVSKTSLTLSSLVMTSPMKALPENWVKMFYPSLKV